MLTWIKLGKFLPWKRRALWFAGISVLLLLGLYLGCAPLLTGLASAWIVEEPVAKVDAIVVLGGGLEHRPFAAARLFREGVAPRVLYMNVQLGPAEELGVQITESETTRRILLSNGVPELAMTAIGDGVASTYDESCAVRDWVNESGAKSILIPTDLFHTRRVRWLFQKQFREMPVRIQLQAVDPIRYRMANWWQHEEGVVDFQNEVIKFLYYRAKY